MTTKPEEVVNAVPPVYVIGGYRFRLVPMTLRNQERLGALLTSIGVHTWTDFLQLTGEEFIQTLRSKCLLRQTFEFILEWEDRTLLHRWWREFTLWIRRRTKGDVVLDMGVELQIRVFNDFFVNELGKVTVFATSLTRMLSSSETPPPQTGS